MVRKASLKLVDHPLYYRRNQLGKSGALSSAVELTVQIKNHGRPFAEKQKMVSYRQFGIGSLAFIGYRNGISDTRHRES